MDYLDNNLSILDMETFKSNNFIFLMWKGAPISISYVTTLVGIIMAIIIIFREGCHIFMGGIKDTRWNPRLDIQMK
jgi:hypothetical protein